MIGTKYSEYAENSEEAMLFKEIDDAVEAYAGQEGALIMVLHRAQEIFGYLPERVQRFVADRMELPLSEVSGVVSFYSFFSMKKRGKHTVRVCQGTACYVRGGKKVVEAIKKELGIDVDETTEDGEFSFEIARCIGACGLAPAMMVDDEVYKQVTPTKVHNVLKKVREESALAGKGGEK